METSERLSCIICYMNKQGLQKNDNTSILNKAFATLKQQQVNLHIGMSIGCKSNRILNVLYKV